MALKKKAKFGISFQRQIVACFVTLPDFCCRFRDLLTENVIDDPDLSTIVGSVREIIQKTGGILPTRASIEHACPSQRMVIRDLFAMETRDHSFVASEVSEFARQKACEAALLDGAKLVKNGDASGVPKLFQDALMVGHDVSDVGEYLHEGVNDRILEYKNPQLEMRIPTGLAHLDQLLGGGVGRGELIILAGPPKGGKSFGLVNVAFGSASALYGHKVVYYALEMKQRRVLRRLDQRIAGAASELLKTEPDKFTSALSGRLRKLVSGNILVKSWPTRTATASMIAAHLARTIAMGFRPDLMVVDYGDIMKPERRLGEARHEQASCFEDLRRIAGEFNIGCVSATQLNRGSLLKDTPDMTDVAECFEKVMIADGVIGIGRTKEEAANKRLRLIMMGLREEQSNQIIHVLDDRSRALWRTLEIANPTFEKAKTSTSREDRQNDAIARAKDRAKGGKGSKAGKDEAAEDLSDEVEV